MANIRIDLTHAPLDGETVSFKAPCNASDITGMVIYYENDAGALVSQAFTLSDANGGNIGMVDNVFAEGAIVKVILDTGANNAFVQNPDTNTYLEGRFDAISASVTTQTTKALDDAKSYADQKIAEIPAPDVSGQINAHDSNTSAHSDIRAAISSHAERHKAGGDDPLTPSDIGAAAAYTYGTEDIEAGSASPYETGHLHFVYEA